MTMRHWITSFRFVDDSRNVGPLSRFWKSDQRLQRDYGLTVMDTCLPLAANDGMRTRVSFDLPRR